MDATFVDIDVAKSFQLKADAPDPARIILSFERWRAWVMRMVDEFDGEVLNSNGDELMSYFQSAVHGCRASRAILADLARFNAEENELTQPFRLRIGIHTGQSLVDRDRGIAYSPVLDVAGHLQKQAPVDGLLLSEATEKRLDDEHRRELALVDHGECSGLRCYAWAPQDDTR